MKTKTVPKRVSMGSVLLSAGLFMKAFQILLLSLGVAAAQSSISTLTVTCVLFGGACVFALERRGAVSVFAMLAGLLTLLGIVLSDLGSAAYAVIYYAVFVAFALMLWSMKRGKTRGAAVAVILLCALTVLQNLNVCSLPASIVTAILFAVYAIMGAGLFF